MGFQNPSMFTSVGYYYSNISLCLLLNHVESFLLFQRLKLWTSLERKFDTRQFYECESNAAFVSSRGKLFTKVN